MKSSCLSPGIVASFIGDLAVLCCWLQAVMVLSLVISIGLVEAGEIEMAYVIELQLRSTSPHETRDILSMSSTAHVEVTMLSPKRSLDRLPRQRNPELSSQHLVVVGLNAQGQEISRTAMLDPRLLRAETTDASEQLTPSEFLYRNDVTFSVTIPADPRTHAVRIYKPRWTGKKFALDLIGEACLPAVDHD